MKEPIYVAKPFLPPKNEYNHWLDKIWETGILTNQGPLHQLFESSLSAQTFNGLATTLTVNGHLALEIAVKALGLSGEIITTPFTFVSTTHSLTLNNITPIFCDINEKDLNLDADKIESLITDKTTGIMPVHVYGHPCDVEKIEAIAKKHDLKVIYDAAHAFGMTIDGKSIAGFGDVSMFSFHATKLFHTIEGGAAVCQDKSLKPVLDAHKNFGIEDEETVNTIGGNAKMNEFQAAMGLSILPYLDDIIEKRRKIALRYRENLDEIDGVSYFTPELDSDKNIKYNYAYFPVIIDTAVYGKTRDEVYDKLKAHNVYSRKYFYPLISDLGCYNRRYNSKETPIAKKTASRILCLPIYESLTIEQVDYICGALKTIRKGR